MVADEGIGVNQRVRHELRTGRKSPWSKRRGSNQSRRAPDEHGAAGGACAKAGTANRRAARRAWRRIRRYRDQSALCLPGEPRPFLASRHRPDGSDGAAVADPVVARSHRHRQIRHPRHARGQPGRGRHAGAHGARATGLGGFRHARRARPDRHHRRLPLLRRRRDHARDLGALRGRGARGFDAIADALRAADLDRHHRRAVLGATLRHRQCRARVRAGDGLLVPHARGARARAGGAPSLCPARGLPDLRVRPRLAAPVAGFPGPRIGGALRDRGGGALRGYGAFRRAPDPAHLALLRAALPRAQLFRPGCARAGGPGRGGEPVLPSEPRLAAAAARHPRHDGDHHREPGAHLGRVLRHPPVHAARVRAAHGRLAHEPYRGGPDLRAAGQFRPRGRGARAGGRPSAAATTWPRPTASRSPAPSCATRCWPPWCSGGSSTGPGSA